MIFFSFKNLLLVIVCCRYTALKQIKGISSEGPPSLPTSSKLSKAIESQKPDTVAQLLEGGVDPTDVVTVYSPLLLSRLLFKMTTFSYVKLTFLILLQLQPTVKIFDTFLLFTLLSGSYLGQVKAFFI